MKPQLPRKTLLSLIVLGGAALSSIGLIALHPDPKPRALETALPVVDVVVAQPRADRPIVRAQGTLESRDEIELVAEVSGRVVWVSPAFDGAGEFTAGQTLARIAADDYEIAAQRARAALQRAESQLALARAALSRSQALFDAGAASPAAHEQVAGNVQVSEANVADARAALAGAELALARTHVRAPFAGRVRERKVALGQHLSVGTPVARVYRGGAGEVTLALRAEDAAFIDLPKRARDPGPRVTLHAKIGGASRALAARLVGSAGALDPETRLLSVVARVEAPAAEREALAMGAFVEAEIEGREVADLVRVPRAALAGESSVVLVDAKDELAPREVALYRVDDDFAWISGGLAAGDRVCARAPSALPAGTRVLAKPLPGDAPLDAVLATPSPRP
jgi:RND family efflux transporter MFP subunit